MHVYRPPQLAAPAPRLAAPAPRTADVGFGHVVLVRRVAKPAPQKRLFIAGHKTERLDAELQKWGPFEKTEMRASYTQKWKYELPDGIGDWCTELFAGDRMRALFSSTGLTVVEPTRIPEDEFKALVSLCYAMIADEDLKPEVAVLDITQRLRNDNLSDLWIPTHLQVDSGRGGAMCWTLLRAIHLQKKNMHDALDGLHVLVQLPGSMQFDDTGRVLEAFARANTENDEYHQTVTHFRDCDCPMKGQGLAPHALRIPK